MQPSISTFGTPAGHDGVFGAAERYAATVHGADRAMFSVHGSSGSNAVVARMLAMAFANPLVLCSRNVHHSVVNAFKAYGVDFRFLPSVYDASFEALLPPTAKAVRQGLSRYPQACAVIYTSPTYEGLAARTQEIAAEVRGHSSETLLIVDEAWGAHLRFSPHLPKTAMELGADICVQSTHKLGGSLQQTGLLLWREDRVDSELLARAFSEYATTSPSFHLLASIDASLRMLAAHGGALLERSIERTDAFKAQLRDRIPLLGHFDSDVRLAAFTRLYGGYDVTKTSIELSRYSISGYELGRHLISRRVVPEKTGVAAVMFITTFQLRDAAVAETVDAVASGLVGNEVGPRGNAVPVLDPFGALDDAPVLPPHQVARYATRCGQDVPLHKAEGEIAAEAVEAYPPGIPAVLEGFRVKADAISYLTKIRDLGGTIVARDPSLATLRVFPQSHAELLG